MRLSFRAKLMSIVGIAALAFVTLMTTGQAIHARGQRVLGTIEHRYVARVDLEPQLESQIERLQRAFQDAVAIHDMDGLDATRTLEAGFLERLDSATGAVDPPQAAALRDALRAYYDAAYDVSRRLISNETGEALVDALAGMQRKLAKLREQLHASAAIDRNELAAAFASTTKASESARTIQLAIIAACMVTVLTWSLWLSQGVLRDVASLTAGLRRFGTGDFSQPVAVGGHDELELVAQKANDMAASLERLIRERDRAESALTMANRELEAFSYSVAHDLRAPLRGINGFSRALIEDWGDKLDGEAKESLDRIAGAAQRMGQLIDALLSLARVSRTELRRETVDLSAIADAFIKQLRSQNPERTVDFVNEPRVTAWADRALLQAVLENLLGNAWKFTGGRPSARIEFGSETLDGARAYFVRDTGAGFDMAYAQKLFAPFQRLHSTTEFAGTGIGLATVQRIVHRHGGRIWAESAVGSGATFHFTLPGQKEGAAS